MKKTAVIGGGPAGLYLAILLKKRDPGLEVEVFERNRPADTFGFGVVFSDATLSNLQAADAESHRSITAQFAHWDDIETHVRGQVVRSTGHGFCGLERKQLLLILQERCRALGVKIHFEAEIKRLADVQADLIVGSDGVASWVRDELAAELGPSVDVRPNRFVWLGTTFPFRAFTFYFKEHRDGMFRVHAYRYSKDGSTFIVECTAETFARTGLSGADEQATIAYLEGVFADELDGHRLVPNRSIWRNFPTVRNRRWHAGNVVLLGDAAHTAHYSIGSGTKLAMEDSIALAQALADSASVAEALPKYESARRPAVDRTQRAAQISLEWFEHCDRYLDLPPLMFTMSLMTRSLRVTHDALKKRDPDLIARFDEWFAGRKGVEPWQVPFERGVKLPDRVLYGAARPAWLVGGTHIQDVPWTVVDSPADVAGASKRPVVVRGGDADLAWGVAAKQAGADVLWVRGTNAIAAADRLRQELALPVVCETGFASGDDVSTVIAAGRADLCVVG